jgi:signal peptide peptidase SppA
MKDLALGLLNLEPLLIREVEAVEFIERVTSVASRPASEAASVAELLSAGSVEPYVRGSTLVVPFVGVVGSDFSPLEKMLGGFDVNEFADTLESRASAPGIKRVVLDFNSPGGTVGGVEEAAEVVRNLAKEKKVISYVAPGRMAASAAYWVASQATEVVVAPSAKVGSIGALVSWVDRTKQLEQLGLRVEVLRAGKHKAGFVPGTTVSDEEKEIMQAAINEVHSRFKTAVKSVRKGVAAESMEGQVFTGREAVAKGLATGTANSLNALLSKFEKVSR